MHADYFSPSRSRIRIVTDRIEYYNPGGLPKPFNELKNKDISLPRNPVLAKLFRMVKLAENAGFGLDKIDDNWRAYNHTRPEFLLEFDSVVLSFILETIGDNVGENVGDVAGSTKEGKTTDKIIRLVAKNREIGITIRSVERNLEKLKKLGLLKRIGPDKGGYWQHVSDK